jgi:two-component system, OmpR family, sensor histidine kinase KdpD
VGQLPAVNWSRVGRALGAQFLALFAATAVAMLLERGIGLHPASSVYLLAVAAIAIGFGTAAAVGTALGAFLTYNFLFVPPLYTFTVGAPNEILNLLLLLILGILIGRLAGLQRDRARDAAQREREARALFAVTRSLAGARRARDAFPTILDRLRGETRMRRLWIGLGPTEAQEQVFADTGEGQLPRISQHFVLRRTVDERHSDWVRIKATGRKAEAQATEHAYRVAISDGTDATGSLWALRGLNTGPPTAEESRLLAATADSIGQSVLRDSLARQAIDLEIAQRSDELKSALLDSVSHDLRTPLATIRAAAGSLADDEISWTDAERDRTARQIDFEAERLNRIVSNLLDMSRIQGGAIQPEIEMLPVEEACRAVLQRAALSLGERPVRLEVTPDLPPVLADPVMLEEVLVNLLENVVRYTPHDAPVLMAASAEDSKILLRVDDGGTGIPPEGLAKIFEKFYRDPSTRGRSGRGTGLGLAVVKGMIEAMDGNVWATRSELGGLGIRIELPAGSPAPESAQPIEPRQEALP